MGELRKTIAKPRWARLLIAACCSLLLVLALWPRGGSAHEPITTKVRFNKEVIRVFQQNCLGCHREGGIAPMSLASYEEARPWAKAIKEEILEKRMPPWHAVRGYGEFRNAPPLTQREIDLIVNWVEGGAPKGDDKLLPAGPLYSNDWPLGKPDLVLKPKAEYKVASDADERRSFVLPTKLSEDHWIEAIDLKPGDGRVVHCATFYIDSQKDAAKDAARADAVKTPVATWMPGQKTVAFIEGAARLLAAGSRVVMKVHYRGAGEATKDLSQLGLYFAKAQPRKQVSEISISDPQAIIPAGAQSHRIKASTVIESDAEAVAILPRVSPLVVSLQATAYKPDGSEEVLIWARGYRFDWQPTYHFKRAVALPKGTRIEVIAYLDNSGDNANNPASPPRQLRWSELSSDPLCTLMVASNRASND